jgi:hypothetical protein
MHELTGVALLGVPYEHVVAATQFEPFEVPPDAVAGVHVDTLLVTVAVVLAEQVTAGPTQVPVPED